MRWYDHGWNTEEQADAENLVLQNRLLSVALPHCLHFEVLGTDMLAFN